jgi:hypothetical protein
MVFIPELILTQGNAIKMFLGSFNYEILPPLNVNFLLLIFKAMEEIEFGRNLNFVYLFYPLK